MKWYLEVLKKYVVFDGISGREEFWWFFLFNLIVSIVLGVVDNMTGSFHLWAELGLFQGIYSMAILVPAIAVSIRRLHDTNRSGWWVLITPIPIIVTLAYLVLMALSGTPEENQYGGNPKSSAA